jgi:hypothetical protein
MFVHVDGHAIPLFTDADIADDAESREEYNKIVSTPLGDGGAISAVLPGSLDKAIPYTVLTESGTRVLADCTVVQPPGSDDMNLASMRPVRIMGKPNRQADALHQVRLFHAVGSVAVAGGHVEMAMKRVLVTLRGGQNSDLARAEVPAEWSILEDKLKRASKPHQTTLQKAVFELLAGAEVSSLRDGRNDVVHGYWWLIPMGTDGLVSSRYYRPKKHQQQAPAQIHPTLEMLEQLAGGLFDLAHALEALVTPHWPLAVVPGLKRFDNGDIELDSRPDRHRTNSGDLRPPEPDKPKPGQRPAASTGRRKRKRQRGRH